MHSETDTAVICLTEIGGKLSGQLCIFCMCETTTNNQRAFSIFTHLHTMINQNSGSSKPVQTFVNGKPVQVFFCVCYVLCQIQEHSCIPLP